VNKSLVNYYKRKGKKLGFIKENPCGALKPLELTQAGKKFLDQYSNPNPSSNAPTCRLENVRI
jgi:hypothetical protein